MWMVNAAEYTQKQGLDCRNKQRTVLRETRQRGNVTKQETETAKYTGVRSGRQDVVSFSEIPEDGRVLVREKVAGAVSTKEKPQEEENCTEDERGERAQQERFAAQKEMFEKMLQKQREAAKNGAKRSADLAKIMEIARRIANGDIVPQSDEKKLMEFSADLYQVAKAAAIVSQDKEHRKYDALFEDEEEDKRKMLRDLKHETASEGNWGGSETASFVDNCMINDKELAGEDSSIL